MIEMQKVVKCPVHQNIIGKYDSEYGLKNVIFYCPKCKKEYTITIAPEKNKKSIASSEKILYYRNGKTK